MEVDELPGILRPKRSRTEPNRGYLSLLSSSYAFADENQQQILGRAKSNKFLPPEKASG